MKRYQSTLLDIICAIIYTTLSIIFYGNRVFSAINFILFLFVLILDCVFYVKKRYLIAKFSNVALVIMSISYITSQMIQSGLTLLLISCAISLIIVIIVFCQIDKPSVFSIIISIFIITAVFLGQIQNIDKTFIQERKTILLSVEDKSMSGKFGFYDYIIQTNEYQGNTLVISVDKSTYEKTTEGDLVTIEIREGLLGYQYYVLLENDSQDAKLEL